MKLESIEHNLCLQYKQEMTEKTVKIKRLEADIEALKLKQNHKYKKLEEPECESGVITKIEAAFER